MCTIPVATLAFTALATGISGAGMYGQTRSANEAARYNARIAEVQAQDVEARGFTAEAEHRAKVLGIAGRQRVGLAGAGVAVGQGTALDITSETLFFGNRDALTIRFNAAREAFGLRSQGALAGVTASPLLATGGSLLTGVSTFGSQFATYRQQGLV